VNLAQFQMHMACLVMYASGRLSKSWGSLRDPLGQAEVAGWLRWSPHVLHGDCGRPRCGRRSTITQQLVRNYFLRELTAQENSIQLGHGGLLPRVLSSVIGSRGVNRLYRKLEEIRLSLCDKYSERDPKN
jgi:hypothetical protein